MKTKFSPHPLLIRKMSSISDDSSFSSDNDSDNREPSQGFCSAPASTEFQISPCRNLPAGGGLEPNRMIQRLSLERFVAEQTIIDPTDDRVSPIRAPKRTISGKVLKSLSQSTRILRSPTKKSKKENKKQTGSTESAPAMPLRKASFIR